MSSLKTSSRSISIFSAGQNNCFQLGRGGDCKDPSQVKIADYGDNSTNTCTKYLDFNNLSTISCGNGFTVALFNDGSAYGWGYNENGCLGFSDKKEKNTPKKIECIKNIKMISCGDCATVFLSENKDENSKKKFGVYLTDDLKGLLKIDTEINEEIEYVCCSCSSQVWMIGQSGSIYRYIPNPDENNTNINITKYDNPAIKARQIFAGSGFAAVINENDQEELYGIGKMTGQNDLFVKIESLSGHSIEKVSCFNEHCIVLTKDHRVFAWGKGTFGCLGLGNSVKNTENKFIEIESLKDKEIVDVGAGNSYSCFVSSSGELYSCGLSKDGRTMMGDTNDRKTPEKSKLVANAIKVFCGSSHTIIECCTNECQNPHNDSDDVASPEQNEVDSFLTMEQMRLEVDELRRENRIIREENYRLRSANLSLEAENTKLQKTLEKVTKKKIVEGCMSDAEYSNPVKMFSMSEISKMKKLQQTNETQLSDEFKVESTTNYAIKYLKMFSNEPKMFKHYLNQHSQILTTLHPCVTRVIGFSFDFSNNADSQPKIPCIVTENYDKKLENLFSDKSQIAINNTDKAKMIVEIVLGMRYLHSMNVSHKNLNPSSIFLSKNNAKLADIGTHDYNDNPSFISAELKNSITTEKVEKTEKIELDKKCDLFAFGSLLYYILSEGSVPSPEQQSQIIQDNYNDFTFLTDDKNRFNDLSKEIIRMCWKPENKGKDVNFSDIFDKLKYENFQIAKDVCAAAIEKTVFEIEYFEQKQQQIKQRILNKSKSNSSDNNPNESGGNNSAGYPVMPPSLSFNGEPPAVSPRIRIRKPPVVKPVAGKTSK